MTSYRVADGHDVALGSLTVLDPQPASPGLQYVQEAWGGSGPYRQGPYWVFSWNNVDESTLRSILTAFGLDAAETNDVTAYGQDDRFNWVRKNGTAYRSVPGAGIDRRPLRFPSLEIVIVNLEDAA